MSGEKENSSKWIKVDDSVKEVFGEYHAKGMEIALNTGMFVYLPPIEGLSPSVKSLDLKESSANILADPTENEKKRWIGMAYDEILQDIEEYLRKYTEERGIKLINSEEE